MVLFVSVVRKDLYVYVNAVSLGNIVNLFFILVLVLKRTLSTVSPQDLHIWMWTEHAHCLVV
ncbi:hypothetical protein NECAME_16885 [Necator americanus]|uniref:Uncharacterized protein n=1 Tax=Necator americanus TaxID=51031 RepID=W2TVT7_NECAM|nr:hypothetical protein NECAME_16885 [Necator americanus]ETN85176.1 hypothetical protein NECAME_16885 [Necator americanus]